MLKYIIRRILAAIPTVVGITIVVFFISRIAPGDPVSWNLQSGGLAAGKQAAEVEEAQKHAYGLDRPLVVQYVSRLWNLLRFDFGYSISYNRPVTGLLKERLPVTLFLNFTAFIIIYMFSIPVGACSAVSHGRFFDRFSSIVLMVLWSVPIILVSQMMLGYLCGAGYFSFFPPGGLSSDGAEELPFFSWFLDRLWHLVLPVICLSYTGFAYVTKQVRAGILESLYAPYVKAARAKGLSEKVVFWRHVFRNSLISVITVTATLVPAMLGGSVIVETIFGIPGMGLLAYESAVSRDYNVVMSVAIVSGVVNVCAILLADLAYSVADPRVGFGQKS